jgi:hypothetical protein
LRYFLSRHIPTFTRVLLVESGSRGIFDRLIPRLIEAHGEDIEIDLVTCHTETPEGFRGQVYRVQDYTTSAARGRLYRELSGRQYVATGILCSNEAIMTKWKWMLAARLPAKVFVINEHADFLWLDRAHFGQITRMARIRSGFTGASISPSVLRVLVLPFSLVYLLIFAAVVHTKRRMRTS